MRIQLVISTAFLSALSLAANPGDSPNGKPVDPTELAQSLKRYQAIKTLTVSFHQTKWISDLNLSLKSEGSLTLERPKNVTWLIRKPSRVKAQFTGDEFLLESGSGRDRTVQRWKIRDIPSEKAAQGIHSLLAWLKL